MRRNTPVNVNFFLSFPSEIHYLLDKNFLKGSLLSFFLFLYSRATRTRGEYVEHPYRANFRRLTAAEDRKRSSATEREPVTRRREEREERWW